MRSNFGEIGQSSLRRDTRARAQAAIGNCFPDPEASGSTAEEVNALNHAVPFPFTSDDLNRHGLDTRVIDVVEGLLGTTDLRLTSSFIQANYGTTYGESRDQTLRNAPGRPAAWCTRVRTASTSACTASST